MEIVNTVDIFKMKQEWEDDITKEDEKNIKGGLICRCYECHAPLEKCGWCSKCKNKPFTYWGY